MKAQVVRKACEYTWFVTKSVHCSVLPWKICSIVFCPGTKLVDKAGKSRSHEKGKTLFPRHPLDLPEADLETPPPCLFPHCWSFHALLSQKGSVEWNWRFGGSRAEFPIYIRICRLAKTLDHRLLRVKTGSFRVSKHPHWTNPSFPIGVSSTSSNSQDLVTLAWIVKLTASK